MILNYDVALALNNLVGDLLDANKKVLPVMPRDAKSITPSTPRTYVRYCARSPKERRWVAKVDRRKHARPVDAV